MARGQFSILIFENLQMIMIIAIPRSMANTISMTMTTNLMLDNFVTFFHQHYNVWDDSIVGLRNTKIKEH